MKNSTESQSLIAAPDHLVQDIEKCIELATAVVRRLEPVQMITHTESAELAQVHRELLRKGRVTRALMADFAVPEELRRRFEEAIDTAHAAIARLTTEVTLHG